MIPEDGTLDFKTGASALIACTSDTRPNYLDFNEKPSSTIFCVDGKSFNINNQQANVEEFNECKTVISGSVMNRNEVCGKSGTKLSIGFQLSDGKGFVNFIDVCYNKKTASTIYTKHTINGKAIKNAMKSNTRPGAFKTAEVPSNIAAATSFTKASQMKRFTTIFGKSLLGNKQLAQEYMTTTFLSRGHLTPDGDGIFVSWQMATYFYVNVVPQWQSINNGNWKSIEGAVRRKAGQLKSDCLIFTGAHEILVLNNIPITLHDNAIEVPLWSWKIIKVPSKNSGIAFVTLNNPFQTFKPTPLCKDICKETKWDTSNFKDFKKGFTICCKISDLMNVITAIPEEAKADHILQK
ncbi:unnamed protein product [Diamesa serratosioi]